MKGPKTCVGVGRTDDDIDNTNDDDDDDVACADGFISLSPTRRKK